MINKFIAYQGVTYIRSLTVSSILFDISLLFYTCKFLVVFLNSSSGKFHFIQNTTVEQYQEK